MTRNYDKFCALFDERINGLKRAVENLDRKNFRWHSFKIEGMLDAAESILNAEEGLMIYNKYSKYPDLSGVDKKFWEKMNSLYGENWW